jgi:hypothetical protein
VRKLAALIAPMLLAGAPAFGAIVYQSTGDSGSLNINGNAFDYLGDSAYLAGTEREITQIDVLTRFFASGTGYAGPVTLELYADMSTPDDGLPDDVDPVTAGNQYQILASSTTTLSFGPSGVQDQTATFLFSNVTVPDRIVFVMKQDVFENNFALVLGSPATIGDSFQVSGTERIVLSSQSSTNFQRANVGGPEVVATIHAVPEPAALSLLGAAGLLAFRRRRQG